MSLAELGKGMDRDNLDDCEDEGQETVGKGGGIPWAAKESSLIFLFRVGEM